MNKRKWETYLKSLGLTKSEADVYLHILETGPGPVHAIAKGTGYSRVAVYNALKSLQQKTLMTTVDKGKKTFYSVEPPEKIVSLAKKKAENIAHTAKEMESQLNELKLIASGDKPVVKLYEGDSAFLEIQKDVMASKPKALFEFGNQDEMLFLNEELDFGEFHKYLDKKNPKRRLWYYSKDKQVNKKEKNHHAVYFTSQKGEKETPFTGDIFMYDDKVWLSAFKGKKMSVMVQSKEIAETLRYFFEMAWKKFNK